MKIDYKQRSPNWIKIKEAIPAVVDRIPFVTYGDTIYAPSIVTHELHEHEKIHELQQNAMGIEKWWDEFLKNPEFRYSQELPAYRVQIKEYCRANKDRNVQARYRWDIARILSGPLYGNCKPFNEVLKDLS